MLVVISSIIVAITVLLAAFVNFSPNVHSIVENDFRRRAVTNANLHSLQRGQLSVRTGNLALNGNLDVSTGPTATDYLYMEAADPQNNINSSVTYRAVAKTIGGVVFTENTLQATNTYTAN